MTKHFDREQLIALVTRIMAADGTEEEIDEMITLLERNVPHPEVCDLIFFPEKEMTADEVVDRALAYEAHRLS